MVDVAPASGILKVCVEPELEILKSVPVKPVVKECVPEVIPFKEYKPLLPQLGIPELTVNTWPALPIVNLLKVLAALA